VDSVFSGVTDEGVRMMRRMWRVVDVRDEIGIARSCVLNAFSALDENHGHLRDGYV
jgi:hypothetical protein